MQYNNYRSNGNFPKSKWHEASTCNDLAYSPSPASEQWDCDSGERDILGLRSPSSAKVPRSLSLGRGGHGDEELQDLEELPGSKDQA